MLIQIRPTKTTIDIADRRSYIEVSTLPQSYEFKGVRLRLSKLLIFEAESITTEAKVNNKRNF